MSSHPFAVSRRSVAGMRTAVWWTFALMLCAASSDAQLTVRVLDYNIHRDVGGGANSDTAAQPALAKIVNFLRPDVWTINELGGTSGSFNQAAARSDLIRFIEEDLTIFGADPREGFNFFVYVASLTDGFISNAIVSRYPLLMAQTFSDGGAQFRPLRGMAFALADLPGETDLGVFTMHLKALNGTTDAERRQEEATVNAGNVRRWLESNPTAGAVVTGDFNESEDAGDNDNWASGSIGGTLPSGQEYRPITTLKSPGLFDAAPVSIRGDSDTISATNPVARFDYVLYEPNHLHLTGGQVFDTRQYTAAQLAALNAANGTSFVAADSATASDHLPVLAVFQIVPEPGTASLILLGASWVFGVRCRARQSG